MTATASELEVAFIAPQVSALPSALAAVSRLDILVLTLWYAVTTLFWTVTLFLSAVCGQRLDLHELVIMSVVLMPLMRPSTLWPSG